MGDHERLNIGFVKATNELDKLTLQLAAVDGAPEELTLDEVKTAFKEPDQTLKKMTEAGGMTPERLFRDLRSYLTRLWLYHKPPLDAASPMWIRLSLTDETDLSQTREIVSLFTFIRPDIELSSVISRDLFQVREKTLVLAALEAASTLDSDELRELLARYNKFKTAPEPSEKGKEDKKSSGGSGSRDISREKIILDLLDHLRLSGERNLENAKALLDIVENEKHSVLSTFVKDILKLKAQVESVMKPSMGDARAVKTGMTAAETEGRRFDFPPPTKTFGAYIADSIQAMGAADKEVVDRAMSIIQSPSYDDSIRANTLYSLREVRYISEETRLYAAGKICGLAKDIPITTDEEGNVFHFILQAPLALGKLGYAKIGGRDVIDALKRFAYYRQFPSIRQNGVRALGLLGMSEGVSFKDRMRILKVLSDLIGDPESQVVANAAYIWYGRVQGLIYHFNEK